MMTGLALLALAPLAWQRACSVDSGPRAAGLHTVGPFVCTIERSALATDGPGRTRLYVQVHLERPGGPVPLAQRVRVDGEGRLGDDWAPVSTEWMIRNEAVQWPSGDWLIHPVLGPIPATQHAGEVRAIFEFQWSGDGCPARAPLDFTFTLPDGRAITTTGLEER